MQFRDLTADDVEVRVQSVKQNGVILLLYKNARVDMSLLDETVGAENWQREHYECKGNLFCSVGIYCEDIKEWVWKDDCGAESYTEKEKGEASDSFKRACFNWGIGRELYTAPFIWVPADKYTVSTGKNGKPTTYDRFRVTRIDIKDKKIVALEIVNAKTKNIVYSFGFAPLADKPATPIQQIKFEINQTKKRLKISKGSEVLNRLESLVNFAVNENITPEQAEVCINHLKAMN